MRSRLEQRQLLPLGGAGRLRRQVVQHPRYSAHFLDLVGHLHDNLFRQILARTSGQAGHEVVCDERSEHDGALA